jgi:hypothetical protein
MKSKTTTSAKRKKVAKNDAPETDGKLLRRLVDFTGKSHQEIADMFNKSTRWLYNLFNAEILSDKNKLLFCKAFNIPMEYFKGGYKLLEGIKEAEKMDGHVNETMQHLIEENNRLKEENMSMSKKLIAAYEELIECRKLRQ